MLISDQLKPVWKRLRHTGIIKKITLVPYGLTFKGVKNSKGFYNFYCQHGKRECQVNTVENCIIHHNRHNFEKMFNILSCIEYAMSPTRSYTKCISKYGGSVSKINSCVDGKEGNHLMYQAYLKTKSFAKNLKYVPYMLFNGKHKKNDENLAQNHLLKVVLFNYLGKKVPDKF